VSQDLAGSHRAAQATYLAGLSLDPTNTALRNNLGLSLALSGDFMASAGMLEDLAKEPAASATNRQNLALVLAFAGRDDEARRWAAKDLNAAAVKQNMAVVAVMRQNPIASGDLARLFGFGPAAAQFADATGPLDEAPLPLAVPTTPVVSAVLAPLSREND
jgi:Flp pilus assembly protein TadD